MAEMSKRLHDKGITGNYGDRNYGITVTVRAPARPSKKALSYLDFG